MITKKQLVALLEQFPDDRPVYYEYDGELLPILGVRHDKAVKEFKGKDSTFMEVVLIETDDMCVTPTPEPTTTPEP